MSTNDQLLIRCWRYNMVNTCTHSKKQFKVKVVVCLGGWLLDLVGDYLFAFCNCHLSIETYLVAKKIGIVWRGDTPQPNTFFFWLVTASRAFNNDAKNKYLTIVSSSILFLHYHQQCQTMNYKTSLSHISLVRWDNLLSSTKRRRNKQSKLRCT